jgi:hypothetical protein
VKVLATTGNTLILESTMNTEYLVWNNATSEYLVPLKDELFTTRYWSAKQNEAERYEAIPQAHGAIDQLNDSIKNDCIVLGVQLVEMLTASELATKRKQADALSKQLQILNISADHLIHVDCMDDGTIFAYNSFVRHQIDDAECARERLIECTPLKHALSEVWAALQHED